MQALSTTHVKAKIKSEIAARRVDDIFGALFNTSPEVTSFLKEKVGWFNELRILWAQHQKAKCNEVVNSWILTPYNSQTAELFYDLETLFPDVIEITRPTEAEVTNS